jgi:hypothetical protein
MFNPLKYFPHLWYNDKVRKIICLIIIYPARRNLIHVMRPLHPLCCGLAAVTALQCSFYYDLRSHRNYSFMRLWTLPHLICNLKPQDSCVKYTINVLQCQLYAVKACITMDQHIHFINISGFCREFSWILWNSSFCWSTVELNKAITVY